MRRLPADFPARAVAPRSSRPSAFRSFFPGSLMSYTTRVLLWRDFYDDELVLFATGSEPEEDDPEALPRSLCVLGCLHLDAILDLFGFAAWKRVAQATRDNSLLPVEIGIQFEDEP